MDYRTLLRKYIAHVTEIQGVDFITMGRTKSSIGLTPEDRADLDLISEEAELAVVLADQPANDWPTLDHSASPNLTALFRLIGSYVRQAGPVNLEFRDDDRVVTTEQDAFMRHLADRALVISDAVVTDEAAAKLTPEPTVARNDPAAVQHVGNHARAILTQLARGEVS